VIRSAVLVLVVASSLRLAAQTTAVDAEFAAGNVRIDGREYAYRRLAPLPEFRTAKQPLVVFLHGAGERGSENLQQLAWLPRELATPDNRRRFPCHLLAVQCPPGDVWADFVREPGGAWLAEPPAPALRAVLVAMEQVLAEPGVDAGRVYLTGLSMGGFGAFELAVRQPDRFAALLPVCGGGDPTTVARLVGLPTLVYHGADDLVVPPTRSRVMVDALRALGVGVVHHELEGVAHDAWRVAYRADTGIAWLFAQDQRQQRRGDFAAPPFVPAIDDAVLRPGTFVLMKGARCVGPAALRTAASLLLDALADAGAPRLDFVDGGAPRGGDLVVSLDPALGVEFELDVGDTLRLVARDTAALRRGAAAAWQALRTRPGARCPFVRVVQRATPRGGTVVLGSGPVPLPENVLCAVVRDCWAFGAGELRGDGLQGLAWLPADARDRMRAFAERHGVALGSSSTMPPLVEGALDVGPVDGVLPDLATILSRTVAGATAAVPFVLRLPPLGPDSLPPVLRSRLAATAERAARQGRAVHTGSFASRLGQLLRN